MGTDARDWHRGARSARGWQIRYLAVVGCLLQLLCIGCLARGDGFVDAFRIDYVEETTARGRALIKEMNDTISALREMNRDASVQRGVQGADSHGYLQAEVTDPDALGLINRCMEVLDPDQASLRDVSNSDYAIMRGRAMMALYVVSDELNDPGVWDIRQRLGEAMAIDLFAYASWAHEAMEGTLEFEARRSAFDVMSAAYSSMIGQWEVGHDPKRGRSRDADELFVEGVEMLEVVYEAYDPKRSPAKRLKKAEKAAEDLSELFGELNEMAEAERAGLSAVTGSEELCERLRSQRTEALNGVDASTGIFEGEGSEYGNGGKDAGDAGMAKGLVRTVCRVLPWIGFGLCEAEEGVEHTETQESRYATNVERMAGGVRASSSGRAAVHDDAVGSHALKGIEQGTVSSGAGGGAAWRARWMALVDRGVDLLSRTVTAFQSGEGLSDVNMEWEQLGIDAQALDGEMRSARGESGR